MVPAAKPRSTCAPLGRDAMVTGPLVHVKTRTGSFPVPEAGWPYRPTWEPS